MWVSGDGFTTFDMKVKPNYKVKTVPAVQWTLAADGNWYGTDRGASSDIFDTDIRIYAQYTAAKEFLDAYEAQRETGEFYVNLSAFSDTEHIFGADVDYSGSIQAYVLELEPLSQQNLKTFELGISLRGRSLTFTGSAAFPTLKLLNLGYKGDQNYTETHMDSYDGTTYTKNPGTKAGVFEGVFNFTDTEQKNLRRYLLTTARTAAFTLSGINGVLFPFGPGSNWSYGDSVKCIGWEDLRMWGVNRWLMRLRLAEVV